MENDKDQATLNRWFSVDNQENIDNKLSIFLKLSNISQREHVLQFFKEYSEKINDMSIYDKVVQFYAEIHKGKTKYEALDVVFGSKNIAVTASVAPKKEGEYDATSILQMNDEGQQEKNSYRVVKVDEADVAKQLNGKDEYKKLLPESKIKVRNYAIHIVESGFDDELAKEYLKLTEEEIKIARLLAATYLLDKMYGPAEEPNDETPNREE